MNHGQRSFCICCVAAAAMALQWPAPARAAFRKIPYVQNMDTASIVICWELSAAATGTVNYGLTLSYGGVASSASKTRHGVALSGLAKDTLYYYQVVSGGNTGTGTFRTAATASKNFRFMAFGDTRTDSANHQAVINRMLAQTPAPVLVLHSGDLTNSRTVAQYDTFFHIEQNLLKDVVEYPANGNHDLTTDTVYYNLPNNELYYRVRYGGAVFYTLADTNMSYAAGSAQYNWFVNNMLADSADPAIRHIFVSHHQPPYTCNTSHPSNTVFRNIWTPLYQRFHVGIEFTGHNHAYEHSKVYTTGAVDTVHYLMTGGGGAPLYTVWGTPPSYSLYRYAGYCFNVVDIRGDSVFSKLVWSNGTVADSFAYKTLKPGGAMGVEFGQFTASSSEAGIELYWTTASESSTYQWRVERSDDGGSAYRTLAALAAAGTTSNPSDYHWVDNSVEAGHEYLYRLAQVDNDGAITHQGPIRARADHPMAIERNPQYLLFASPSPFITGTDICYQANRTGERLTLKIYNINEQLVRTLVEGKSVKGVHHVPWNGTNDQGTSLAAGMYVVHLSAGNSRYFFNLLKVK